MKIISTEEIIQFANTTIAPLLRYVVPDSVAGQIIDCCQREGIKMTISDFNSFERRYAMQDANLKRICLRRSEAIGDTLMATCLPRIILKKWPMARIDAYCDKTTAPLWSETGAHACATALTLEAARAYDWHIMLEHMLEDNGEPDQANCYDDMLGFIGLKPEDVADELKRPVVKPHATDETELEEVWKRNKLPGEPNFSGILIQIQANNPNRTYPAALMAATVGRLLEQHEDSTIVLIGQNKASEMLEFSKVGLLNHSRVINLVDRTPKIRSLIPLLMRAELVICPDSSIGHMAAAFPQVPVISLWGLFNPQDRIKYYANHTALWPQSVCPHAPCRSHAFELPQEQCKDALNASAGKQRFCNVLKSIKPEDICELAGKLINQ